MRASLSPAQTSKQAKERPDITAISMCPGHLQTGKFKFKFAFSGTGTSASASASVGLRARRVASELCDPLLSTC